MLILSAAHSGRVLAGPGTGAGHPVPCPPGRCRNQRARSIAQGDQAARSLICSMSAIRAACVDAIGATFSVVTPDSFMAAIRSAT